MRHGLFGLFMVLAVTAWAQAPGPEVCQACHADYAAKFNASVHGQKAHPKSPASAGGCATCHGDGTEHVQKGGGRGVGNMKALGSKSLAAEEKSAVCLTCHQGGKRIHWQMSAHAGRDVSCTNCHQVHAPQERRDKAAQSELCMSCHKTQRSELHRPSRHPVKEGKVGCTDCHNPHGTAGEKQLVRDNVNDTCYACHMEKRGPFVRTHQPVQENCAICHNPHGTVNDNLLKSRPPFLCQSCHEPTSHRGTQASRTATTTSRSTNFLARGCLNCHTQIHGTNNPLNQSSERTFRR